jgi:hypothetical protein
MIAPERPRAVVLPARTPTGVATLERGARRSGGSPGGSSVSCAAPTGSGKRRADAGVKIHKIE